jgi:hypothetical protein
VVDVWESREAFERFEGDVLAPLGFAGAPLMQFPVHNLIGVGSPSRPPAGRVAR